MTSDEPSLSLSCSFSKEHENSPSFEYEKNLFKAGYRIIAGIDEAGRGPLCGPVSAACVVLEPNRIPEGLDDSKKLKPEKRELLFKEIISNAKSVGIGIIDESEIDRINILRSSILAMKKALDNLKQQPDFLLVDGNRKLPVGIPQLPIIKGDSKSLSISAASIVAKVVRDRIMLKLDKIYPHYQLKRNMGYPTPAHLKALAEFGPVRIHRRSFKPVKFYSMGY